MQRLHRFFHIVHSHNARPRFGGTAGINEFTELRWITIEDPGQGYPI